MYKVCIAAQVLLFLYAPGTRVAYGQDPDEGTLSSVHPHIPEPMVFDLIRPLGAERGEVEVNTLFRFNAAGGHRKLQWAPEVEYAFLKGHGLEFELPMENTRIESLKAALQGTMPGPWKSRFIHGWQVLREGSRQEDLSKMNLLYLAGFKYNRKWSMFTMTGVERERAHEVAYALLGNYSLFFHKTKRFTYGLESNLKGSAITPRSLLVMPQVQLRKSRINVQFGAGWRMSSKDGGPQVGWRISREF